MIHWHSGWLQVWVENIQQHFQMQLKILECQWRSNWHLLQKSSCQCVWKGLDSMCCNLLHYGKSYNLSIWTKVQGLWQDSNHNDNANNKTALLKQLKTMDGRSCNKAMTTTASETSSWKHQETSRRELLDKSATVLCLYEYTQYPRVRNTFTAASYFEVC